MYLQQHILLTSILSSHPKHPDFLQQQSVGVYLLNTFDIPDTFLGMHRAVIRMTKDFVPKDLVFFVMTKTDNEQKKYYFLGLAKHLMITLNSKKKKKECIC